MTIGIYCFENLVDGKKYIGQSINIERRYKEHFRFLEKEECGDENKYFWNALKKYGIQNFSFYILEECHQDLLNDLEVKYIKELNSHKTENGYNVSWGGNSPMRGIEKSVETRMRMSNSKKGKLLGKDNPNYGNKMSEDSKKKISEANSGRVRSEEAKKKALETRIENNGRWDGKNHPNFSKKFKKSSSQYIGVFWIKKKKKWQVSISIDGKRIGIGFCDSEIEAAKKFDKYVLNNNLPHTLNFPLINNQ